METVIEVYRKGRRFPCGTFTLEKAEKISSEVLHKGRYFKKRVLVRTPSGQLIRVYFPKYEGKPPVGYLEKAEVLPKRSRPGRKERRKR